MGQGTRWSLDGCSDRYTYLHGHICETAFKSETPEACDFWGSDQLGSSRI